MKQQVQQNSRSTSKIGLTIQSDSDTSMIFFRAGVMKITGMAPILGEKRILGLK